MADSEPRGDVFDVDRIRGLIELMKEHDLFEVDLEQADQRICLRRGAPEPLVSPPLPATAVPATPATPAPVAESEEHIAYITSPMVGTFYSKPNPNAESFVKIGDRVSADKTVCIVEAMKVFNEIPAEVSGQIVAALVDDGEPVDFGRKLFKVDTSK